MHCELSALICLLRRLIKIDFAVVRLITMEVLFYYDLGEDDDITWQA